MLSSLLISIMNENSYYGKDFDYTYGRPQRVFSIEARPEFENNGVDEYPECAGPANTPKTPEPEISEQTASDFEKLQYYVRLAYSGGEEGNAQIDEPMGRFSTLRMWWN